MVVNLDQSNYPDSIVHENRAWEKAWKVYKRGIKWRKELKPFFHFFDAKELDIPFSNKHHANSFFRMSTSLF